MRIINKLDVNRSIELEQSLNRFITPENYFEFTDFIGKIKNNEKSNSYL
jgi:hypothetical protein